MTKSVISSMFLILTTSITAYAAEVETLTVAAVPEPATVFLLGAGLLGLFMVGRRKKC